MTNSPNLNSAYHLPMIADILEIHKSKFANNQFSELEF